MKDVTTPGEITTSRWVPTWTNHGRMPISDASIGLSHEAAPERLPTEPDAIAARLSTLTNDELDAFVRKLGDSFQRAHEAGPDPSLDDIRTVLSVARFIQRKRRALNASTRAKALVAEMFGTGAA